MPTQLWRTSHTTGDDFIIGSGGPSNITGGGGDDFILGDSGTPFQFGTTTNSASPANIDSPTRWYTEENPFFGDASIPHTSLYVETEAGAGHYASVTVGAGETITIDVDFAGGFSVGVHSYVTAQLIDSGAIVVAASTFGDTELGGAGSGYGEPYITYTNTTGSTQTYTIAFSEYAYTEGADDGGVFEGGETFVANISVTGHAASAPTAPGDDILNGSVGDDWIAGQGGNDILYGRAGNDHLLGGSGNDTLDGGDSWDTAWYSDATSAVVVDVGLAGAQDTGGAGIDTLIDIEHVVGSNYNDTLTGDDDFNDISGGAGADYIYGNGGYDSLHGGDGADRILGGEGGDTIYADRFDYSVWFNNTLYGQGGNDALIGWFGNDRLYGGYGDDIIYDAGGNDVIAGGPGIDRVEYTNALAAVTVNLTDSTNQNTVGAGIDTITSVEGVTGSFFNDTLTGNGADNRIDGYYGNDTVDGGLGDDILLGGYGDDTIIGGSGNDTASYDNIYDATGVEVNLAVAGAQNTLSGGIDTLSGIENLTGSQYNDNLLGNGGANVIDGSYGDDVLRGRGGNDTLFGFWGNDTLIGGEGNDTLDGGDGIDTASYAGNDVRVIVSLGASGPQATGAGSDTLIDIENLVGTSFDDTLTGNGEANRINGGPGADWMRGGGGHDIYIVDNAGDVITEGAAGDTDTVLSSVGYTLPDNIERLKLTGTASINGLGNSLDNHITGNSGNNTLVGGLGNDRLTGGGGADNFRFNTALSASANVDEITDFSVAADTIQLDNDIFTAAGAIGTLAASAFGTGTAAADASDRIIYDPATGRLWYDADGNGAGAAILFAELDPGLALTNADFQIIG